MDAQQQLRRKYAGKTIVVTGATSGNGQALANLLLALGAVVIGLGRNVARLAELECRGGIPYQLDLSDFAAIDEFVTWFDLHYERCDGLFHLAGTTLVGEAGAAEFQAFKAADLDGPVRLAEGFLSTMNRGATVAMVSSIAAAVPEAHGLRQYAEVKGAVASWCGQNRARFTASGANLMLIAMGAIATNVGRSAGLGGAFNRAAEMLLPPPERYSPQILKDAAAGKPASFPGRFASLTTYQNGTCQVRVGRKALVLALEAGVWFAHLGK